MMRDIFICPRNTLLANWSEAFPQATVYASPSVVEGANRDECLFWLHTGQNSQQWIVASIAQILRDFFNPRIVVLANAPDQAEAMLAMSQGAVGYCHAYSPAEVLIEVRTVIAHGGIWLGRELLQRLINVTTGLIGNKSELVAQKLSLLTGREQEVALEAAKGHSNKEIARQLHITERTVKAHLSSSFERLGIKDRLHLALLLNDRPSQ